MSPIIRLLGPGDASVLDNVAPSVFDNAIDAMDGRVPLRPAVPPRRGDRRGPGRRDGFRRPLRPPDKAPQLWINEVGVATPYQGRGIGRRLMERLLDRGRELGCRGVHVGTERSNTAARRLYAAVGGVESPEDSVEFVIDLGEAE